MPEQEIKHGYRLSGKDKQELTEKELAPQEHRKEIEPWLSAIFQCEHLSCLLGNGLTCAVSSCAKVGSPSMSGSSLKDAAPYIVEEAERTAAANNRGTPNDEDYLRIAMSLLPGIKALDPTKGNELETAIENTLGTLLQSVLQTEQDLKSAFNDPAKGRLAEGYLISFLMSFASRLPSRERLNIFTTNYDRLIEYGCDQAGIRIIDRFVGMLSPIFRASRINVDMHYNPPGIRGEPRYLEGVARLFKLHGSLDWRSERGEILRHGMAFGDPDHVLPENLYDSLMIYPNAAKDMETLNYPYAELFRDFAASICRPNAALVVYGFSFGDDHINRTIKDMLKIPSTHLVIIARSLTPRMREMIDFYPAQVSYLYGTHFSDIENLGKYYLPKPSIDLIQSRMKQIKEARDQDPENGNGTGQNTPDEKAADSNPFDF